MSNDIRHMIAEFFSAYPVHTYAKRDVLVQAESDPPGVFYLTDGRVIQYDISPQGNTVVVNSFRPPAFFPMSWAINRTPNPYVFEAATAAKAHVAPAEAVVDFVRQHPDVLFDLLSRVYKGTDGVLRRMAHLMGGSAKTRIMFELINAGLRFGVPRTGNSVVLDLRESDLASYTGLARESVSRSLKALKTDGLIQVNGQGIVLTDITKLEALLGNTL